MTTTVAVSPQTDFGVYIIATIIFSMADIIDDECLRILSRTFEFVFRVRDSVPATASACVFIESVCRTVLRLQRYSDAAADAWWSQHHAAIHDTLLLNAFLAPERHVPFVNKSLCVTIERNLPAAAMLPIAFVCNDAHIVVAKEEQQAYAKKEEASDVCAIVTTENVEGAAAAAGEEEEEENVVQTKRLRDADDEDDELFGEMMDVSMLVEFIQQTEQEDEERRIKDEEARVAYLAKQAAEAEEERMRADEAAKEKARIAASIPPVKFVSNRKEQPLRLPFIPAQWSGSDVATDGICQAIRSPMFKVRCTKRASPATGPTRGGRSLRLCTKCHSRTSSSTFMTIFERLAQPLYPPPDAPKKKKKSRLAADGIYEDFLIQYGHSAEDAVRLATRHRLVIPDEHFYPATVARLKANPSIWVPQSLFFSSSSLSSSSSPSSSSSCSPAVTAGEVCEEEDDEDNDDDDA